MKRILIIAAILIQSLSAAVYNGTATVTSTPQSLESISGLSGQVQRFRISVIPGFSGKIYIGNSSSMNTTTYANTMRVLYPNSAGGWSDQFSAMDPQKRDGIPLNQIFITGDITGERFIWEVEQTGTASLRTLIPFYAGPLAPSNPNTAACWHLAYPSNRMMAGYQVSVVPGMTGKVRIGKQIDSYYQPDSQLRGVGRILWPNTGAAGPDSANTESLDVWSSELPRTGNPIYGNNLCVYPEVYGEFPLVAVWQRTPYAEDWRTLNSEPAYDITQGPMAITGSNQPLSQFGVHGSRMRIWTMPGTYGKVYVGSATLNKATLAGVYKIIYPNPNGGHSDGYDVEFPGRMLGLNSGFTMNGDNAGEFVTFISESERLDDAGWAKSWNPASYTTTLSTTPVQLMTAQSKVSRVTVRNVPGQCAKIYVGDSTMNTSTLAGVYKVLYPNCSGGIGDEFTIDYPGFPEGRQIEQQRFYFAADYAVDVLVETRTNAQHSNFTGNGYYAKQTGTIGAGSVALGSSDYQVSFSIIPGQLGKIRLGNPVFGAATQPDSTYAGVIGVLFPNTGSLPQSNARSESLTIRKTTGTAIWHSWPEITGEKILATVWGF